jgi:hypothetical protein
MGSAGVVNLPQKFLIFFGSKAGVELFTKGVNHGGDYEA